MNTLMQIAPMVMVDGAPNHPIHQMHHQFPHASQQNLQQPITNSMNRSQRCGVCRGCQCKPCGQCTYCQDSPQFGGPGVKKQSCIERRCLRVLENRLQRDAPTFKARVGCNQCEDCRMPDCQICLVCLDKRFFENRYMRGAMCAKKRCNNATSIELPAHPTPPQPQQPPPQHDFRQAPKRSYEQMAPPSQQQQQQQTQQMHFEMKRRLEMQYMGGMGNGQPPVQAVQPMPQQQQSNNNSQQSTNNSQQPSQPPTASLQQHPPPPSHVQEMNQRMMISAPSNYNGEMIGGRMVTLVGAASTAFSHQQLQCQPPPDHSYIIPGFAPPHDFYANKVYQLDEFEHNGDPFIPPSYAPEMKNAVVLQPL